MFANKKGDGLTETNHPLLFFPFYFIFRVLATGILLPVLAGGFQHSFQVVGIGVVQGHSVA